VVHLCRPELRVGPERPSGADAREHDQGASCRVPRLRRHGRDVPAPVSQVPGAALAASAMSDAGLGALISRHDPRRIAFLEGERTITFAEFDALAQQTAGWLAAQGIGRGDRVAVWLVNR